MAKTILTIITLLLFASVATAAEPFCFDEAGDLYRINPQILRAIAKVESNFNPRALNWNRNGSYDFGVMQINSIWAPTLGTERWKTLGDPCSNIKTGASILSNCMKKYGYTWEAIGCYNSQTPDKRDKYAQMVFKQLKRIERDDKQLKASLETAVRDKIEDLVTASQNGRTVTMKLKTEPTIPLPAGATQALSALHGEEQPPQPEAHGAELRASSLFEDAVKGM